MKRKQKKEKSLEQKEQNWWLCVFCRIKQGTTEHRETLQNKIRRMVSPTIGKQKNAIVVIVENQIIEDRVKHIQSHREIQDTDGTDLRGSLTFALIVFPLWAVGGALVKRTDVLQ